MTRNSTGATHENLTEQTGVEMGSDRSFGLVFAAVFAIVGCWPLVSGGTPRYWALAVAVAFALVGVIRPTLLAPLNRLWFRFGLLLSRIANPIVMGLVFFVAVTPTAVIMRLGGKDLLRLRLDKTAASYWIDREPPGPAPDTMNHQF